MLGIIHRATESEIVQANGKAGVLPGRKVSFSLLDESDLLWTFEVVCSFCRRPVFLTNVERVCVSSRESNVEGSC